MSSAFLWVNFVDQEKAVSLAPVVDEHDLILSYLFTFIVLYSYAPQYWRVIAKNIFPQEKTSLIGSYYSCYYHRIPPAVSSLVGCIYLMIFSPKSQLHRVMKCRRGKQLKFQTHGQREYCLRKVTRQRDVQVVQDVSYIQNDMNSCGF